MSDTPKFDFKPEQAFFDCPCFKEDRKSAEAAEDRLSSAIQISAFINAEMMNLCGPRLVMAFVKALSEVMSHVPASQRAQGEKQLHDMLDFHLALNPSKD